MVAEYILHMNQEEILKMADIEEIRYALLYEKNLTALEAELHYEEELDKIAKSALIAAMEFYGGDWAGIVEGDLAMEAWSPVFWYDGNTRGMTATHFREIEETISLEHWLQALYHAEPISIPDTSIYKESNPVEYELYERCRAKSVLAVPFSNNPTGFLIVRNPKRFIDKSSFLQAVAYVVFSTVTERKLLERTSKAFSPEQIKSDKDVLINLFGELEIYTSKGVLKEREMNSPTFCRILAYFLLHSNRPIPARAVYEEIWPDELFDNPGNNMKSMLVRFKNVFNIISDHRLIISTPQGYMLNPELNIMTDVKTFEECYVEAQGAVTTQTKIELLKRAVECYQGELLTLASAEPWIMSHQISYKYKCLGIYTELMKECFGIQNYTSVQYYAGKALQIEKANPDAYYWMIRAMKRQDSHTMVKGELLTAKNVLLQEDYEELIHKLNMEKDE